ncbi:MAG: 8-oxo-dGTP pyrophosphatase MutT (NUDIX family) [Alphaproteobacteria bacterium]
MTELDFLSAFNRPWTLEETADYPFLEAKRPAAVLICLFPSQGKLHVLFTQRASHLKHHAGQISFPGGKAEKTDIDLVDTAYREAEEEIGLEREQLRLLGRLGIYRTISGFAVMPIVAIYDKPLNIDIDLIIDPNEVANVFSVPLAYLMDIQRYYVEIVKRHKTSFPVYFIPYEQRMIWGATAGILAQLQKHITTHLI